jgi:hypothetical protein
MMSDECFVRLEGAMQKAPRSPRAHRALRVLVNHEPDMWQALFKTLDPSDQETLRAELFGESV